MSRVAGRFAAADLSRRCALAYHPSLESCSEHNSNSRSRTIVSISCVHPDLRGTVPAAGWPATKSRSPRAAAHAVRAVASPQHSDVILFDPRTLGHRICLCGVDPVLLGTDCPRGRGDHDPLGSIAAVQKSTAVECAATAGGSAARVLGIRTRAVSTR